MMEEEGLKGILGKNVRFFRSRRGFSQADLAERAEISITFLSNIERGAAFPKAGTICNLAKGLEVEVYELFKGELTGNEAQTAAERFGGLVKRRVNEALDEIFGPVRG